jgi:hypothetical protein
MIAKGNARAGGQNLATHLLNAHDNERVEIAETRGSVANDLHGAFAEWRAQAKATKCEKYLYSLSVNPDQRQGRLTREQYFDYLARVETRLGLSKQARVVVFHEKKDKDGVLREHCHAVWSRIDARAGRAVQLSHDRMKLRTVARQFAKALGLSLPKGLAEDRGKERHQARKTHANLKEKQQQERSGLTKEERQAELTRAWQRSDDGPSLAAAIEDAGYILAQGDSRAYVVVDRAGEVHALARQLIGVKTAELKARLSPSLPPSSLPVAHDAVQQMAARRDRLRVFNARTATTGPTPDERRESLLAKQAARLVQQMAERAQMEARHGTERQELARAQRLTVQFSWSQAKVGKRPSGTVRKAAMKREQRQQEKTLAKRHKAELRDMTRQEKALTALDKREQRSLETAIRRDDFQSLAREIKARPVSGEAQQRDDRKQSGAGVAFTKAVEPVRELTEEEKIVERAREADRRRQAARSSHNLER